MPTTLARTISFSVEGVQRIDASTTAGFVAVPTQVTLTTGDDYSLQLFAVANPPTVTWTIAGTLPTGLQFDEILGLISGTPTAVQSSSSVTVTATNRGGNRSVSISYEVQAVATLPVVEDPGAQLFTYGVQDGFTLRATGAPTPSWGLQSGSTLPPGIGIVDNGDGTATVSGTPTDVFSTADVVFVASNSAGDVPLTVSFTVQGVLPRLVAIGAQTLTVNQVYPGITLTTIAGYPAPTWSATGLPSGLTLNPVTGEITGTPDTVGVTEVVITATNSVGTSLAMTVTFTVLGIAPQVTAPTAAIPAQVYTYGVAITAFNLGATGAPTPSWGLQSGSTLPPGIGIVDNGDGTATVSGTPTDVFPIADVVFVASNSVADASLTLSFRVQGVIPVLSAVGAQTLNAGQQYTYQLTITQGYPAPTWSAPLLPSGLNLNAATGEITGSANDVGVTDVVFIATNSAGSSLPITVTFTVNESLAAPVFGAIGAQELTVGEQYDFDFPISGRPSPVITERAPVSYRDTATASFDINLVTAEGRWRGAARIGNRIHFVSQATNVTKAFDFNGDEQAGDSITLVGAPSSLRAMIATNTRIFVIGQNGTTAFAFDHSGNSVPTENIVLGTGSWEGGTANDDFIWFVDNTSDSLVAYNHSRNRVTEQDISLGAGNWRSIVLLATRMYVLDDATDSARAFNYDITDTDRREPDDDIEPPALTATGWWHGSVASDTHVWFVNAFNSEARAFELYRSTLPDGIDLVGHTLSGVPTTPQAAQDIIFDAVNSEGDASATVSFTVTALAAPQIAADTVTTYDLTVGDSINTQLVATGHPTPTWSAPPDTFPEGITLSSTGLLSGTATAQFLTQRVIITASNGVDPADTVEIQFIVREAAAFGTILSQQLVVGTPYNYTLPVTGVPQPVITEQRSDPARSSGDDWGLFGAHLQGAARIGNRIYFTRTGLSILYAFDFDGNRQQTDNITVTGTSLDGLAATDNRIYTVDDNGTEITVFNHSGVAQASENITIGSGTWLGLTHLGNKLYVLNNHATSPEIRVYNLDTRTQIIAETITLPSGTYQSILALDDFIYVVDAAPALFARAYDYDGAARTGNDLNLGIGLWTASFWVPERGLIHFVENDDDVTRAYSDGSNLPRGITLEDGVLDGTPVQPQTARTATFIATNSVGNPDTTDVSFTVTGAPQITTRTFAAQSYRIGDVFPGIDVDATGNPVPTWSATGLPPGLAIDGTTGEITGTFTALYATAQATITASNGVNPDDSITITFTVTAALAAPLITTRTFPAQSYRIGDVFPAIDVDATGNPTPTWLATGLPTGLQINATTGEITGTFTALYATAQATITASNGVNPDDSITITFTVAAALAAPLISPRTVDAQVYPINVAITAFTPFTVTGVPVPTWSATGLPTGLQINATTGEITGTPTAEQSATNATITASNGVSPDDSVTISFTVVVLIAPQFVPSTQPSVTSNVGASFTLDLNATGNPAPTYSAANLPSGLGIDETTGVITGTYTTEQTRTTTITASNGVNPPATVDIQFTVLAALAAPQITTVITETQTLRTNMLYRLELEATGFPTEITWSVTSGTLPNNVILNTATGEIRGTPDTDQSPTAVVITASNGVTPDATITITFEVVTIIAPGFGAIAPQMLVVNMPYNFTLPVTGTPTPVVTEQSQFLGRAISSGNINLAVGVWRGGTRIGNRIHFVRDTTNVTTAYDFNGGRQSSDDITLTGASSIRGIVSTDDRIYVFSLAGTSALAFNHSGGRVSGDDIDLSSFGTGNRWEGATRTDSLIYFVDNVDDVARAYNFDRTRSAENDISLGEGAWRSALALRDRIYFLNDGNIEEAQGWDLEGNRQTGFDLSFVPGFWHASAASDDRMWFVDNSTDIAAAYISYGSALPTGVTYANGVVSGTPTVVGQDVDITFIATNSSGDEASVTVSFEVAAAPSAPQITAPTITSYLYPLGSSVALDLVAASSPQVSLWSVTSGTLPSGLSFSSTSGNAVQIVGTVDTIYPSAEVVITASNGVDPDATINIQFTVIAALFAPQFVPSTQPAFTRNVGDEFTLDLNATGNPTPTYSSPNLPNGLSIDATTGVITGTFATPQTITSTITATNSEDTDTVTISFTVNALVSPSLAAIAAQSYTINVAITPVTLQATGNPTPVISERRGLPQPLTSDFGLSSGAWRGAARNGNRIYFVRTGSTTLFAYDWAGGRQLGDDITVTGTNHEGLVFTDTRIFLVDNALSTAFAFDHSGTEVVGDNINIGAGGWAGASRRGDRIYFLDNANNVIRVYTTSGARREAEDITVQNRAYRSILALDDVIYVIADSTNNAYPYDYSGVAQTPSLDLGEGSWHGSVWTPNHQIFFVNAADNTAHAYSDGSNLPRGVLINDGTISGTPTQVSSTRTATFQAKNNVLPDATIDVPFTVTAALSAPQITTRTFPAQSYRIGDVFPAIDVDATGNPAPQWSATGLPAGLQINATTGAITGTFTALYATSNATITASNGISPDDTITIEFTVAAALAAPLITTRTFPAQSYRIGDVFTPIDVNATGNPTPTWSATNLPAGLAIDGTTGEITGTFTGLYPTATATITASNGISPDDSITIEFTVVDALFAPIIPSDALAAYQLYRTTFFTLDLDDLGASGNPAPTWSHTGGTLPPGLNFSGTTLSGTPTTEGVQVVTFTASNGVSPSASIDITFTVSPPLVAPDITTTPFTRTLRVGQAITDIPLNATGNPAPDWSATNLPPGLTFSPTTGNDVVITGTPTAQQDARQATITAQNSVDSDTLSVNFTVLVAFTDPVIASDAATSYDLVTGDDIEDIVIRVTGNPIPQWSIISGQLPTGLSLVTGDTLSVTIRGEPTEVGTFTVTLRALNSQNSDTITITFTVSLPLAAPQITPRTVDAQSYRINVPITPFTPFTVTGNPTPEWSATGLPTGLQINTTTGEITGTPTVAQSATNATITASNGVGNDDSVTISFAVVTGIAPQFGTFADPTLFINTPYSLTLTATGTPEPVITQQLGIPSRDSDRDINLDEGFWHGVFRLGNRLYFIRINSNTLVAYDFDRARQAGQDITVTYTGPSWNDGVATSDRILLVNENLTMAVAFDHNGVRRATDDINFGGGQWQGASINQAGDTLYFLDNSAKRIRVYNTSGEHQSDIGLGDDNYHAIVVVGTFIYATARGSTTASAYNLNNGTADPTRDIDTGFDRLFGGVRVPERNLIYFAEDDADYGRGFTDGNTLPVGLSFENDVVSGLALNTQPATQVTFQASNGILPDATLTLSFTITTSGTAPQITTSTDRQTLIQNEAFTLTLAATGTTPIRWSVVGGALPTDVTLNETTGVVSGTSPNIQEATDVTFRAANSGGDDTVTIPFRVRIPGNPPQFAAVADQMLVADQQYPPLTLTVTGLQPITITQQLGIPSRDSDRDINLDEGFWHGVFRLGNRLYFIRINSNTLVAYDFDRARQAGQDITVAYTGPSWNDGVATSDRILLVNENLTMAVAFDHNGVRQSDDDINLGSGQWQGASINQAGDTLYFLDNSAKRIRVYNTSGVHQSDIGLGDDNYHAIVVVGTFIYATARGSTTASAYNLNDGTADSTRDIDTGFDRLFGGVRVPERNLIYFAEDDADYGRAFTDGNTLPVGISLENDVVSGTPILPQPATGVTFEARNVIGTANITVSFAVRAVGPVFADIPDQSLPQYLPYNFTVPFTAGGLPTTITANEVYSPQRDSSADLTFSGGRGGYGHRDRFWFLLSDRSLRAYNPYTLQREPEHDVNLSWTGAIHGVVEDTRNIDALLLFDNTNVAKAFSYNTGARQSVNDITFPSSARLRGGDLGQEGAILAIGRNGPLYVYHPVDPPEITEHTVLSGNAWTGLITVYTHDISYLVSESHERAYAYANYRGNRLDSDFDIDLSDNSFDGYRQGGVYVESTGRRLIFFCGDNGARAFVLDNLTLPPGITFADGVLSGTPDTLGVWEQLFTATNDEGSATVTVRFTVEVTPLSAPTITSTIAPQTYTAGTTITPIQLTGFGNLPPQWRVQSGSSLPVGLNISLTGEITGTPFLAQDATNTVLEAYNATGTASITISFAVEAAPLPVSRLYFVHSTTVVVYDYARMRQEGEDIALAATSSGGVATATRLYFMNSGIHTAEAYDYAGMRHEEDDIAFGGRGWQGGLATPTRLYFVNTETNRARAYDYAGMRQSGEDIALGSGGWQGGLATPTRLYFVDHSADRAIAYDYARMRQSDDDILLGSGAWTGGLATPTRLYFVDNIANRAEAYNHAGMRQSGEDIVLGSGSWAGGTGSYYF